MQVNLSFTELGIEYRWVGMFGCVLASTEKVKPLTVRVIAEEVMYCRECERNQWFFHGNTDWVAEWVPQRNWDMEQIREFKRKIFGSEISN